MEKAQSAADIMQVGGIQDAELAARMADLSVTVETLAAFRLAPLVAVAWADDRIEEEERYAITKAAKMAGISADDAAMAMLDAWTTKRPPSELIDSWCDYARSLAASLEDSHRQLLKQEVVGQIEAVAEAAGGVLGFGSVSPSERAMIARIEDALS